MPDANPNPLGSLLLWRMSGDFPEELSKNNALDNVLVR